MQIKFRGIKCTSMTDAMQYADASGLEPIILTGGCFCVTKAELHRIECARVEFAHITEHNGQLMTVPVN
jgi:hypothetical protein